MLSTCIQNPRVTPFSATTNWWHRYLLPTPQQTFAHRLGTHAKTLISAIHPSPTAATLPTSSLTVTKMLPTFVQLLVAMPLTRSSVSMVVFRLGLMPHKLVLPHKVFFFFNKKICSYHLRKDFMCPYAK